MQGESVPVKVVQAIQKLSDKKVDLIVITRGGGSAADLRWFDASEIAYAIAECSVPIVCAIGHHDDQAIAEEIAHVREKTPTAAAEFVLDCFDETANYITELAASMAKSLSARLEEVGLLQKAMSERLAAAADRTISSKNEQLLNISHSLSHRALEKISLGQQYLINIKNTLHSTVVDALGRKQLSISELEKELVRRDPTPWLKKGWTQLSGESGLLLSVKKIKKGESIHARLLDGRVKMTVNGIVPTKK